MIYEFTKLTEVEALTEVPENATVFAEVDGTVKRVPGNGLGGGSTPDFVCSVTHDLESGEYYMNVINLIDYATFMSKLQHEDGSGEWESSPRLNIRIRFFESPIYNEDDEEYQGGNAFTAYPLWVKSMGFDEGEMRSYSTIKFCFIGPNAYLYNCYFSYDQYEEDEGSGRFSINGYVEYVCRLNHEVV